ncbi:hypothetical protein G1J88_11385 [Tenacibaculum dicentrarchi]|uniref:hypothetical protein n=1 Tax=Tenacibaculum piscium TaxID=1458515 RepID=UPI001EFEA3C9|nr:hypothetical protein [Tenacibaculum piscium]MCG8828982.1 hypothetical protein [Tenacibaculum dicentrarchi]
MDNNSTGLWIAIFSALFAFGSLIVAIIALVKSNLFSQNSMNKSEIQNLISMGNLELSTSERISNSRDKVGDITMIMSPLISKKKSGNLTSDEVFTLEAQTKVLDSAIENNINAYEEACSKYIDGKIDRERFKKSYNTEIRQLVENANLNSSYFNPLTSKFKAILKIYDEWNNLEK